MFVQVVDRPAAVSRSPTLAPRPQQHHTIRCFPGMEVVITDNLSVKMGIANGSRAFVVGLQLTERAAAEPPVFDATGMRQYNVRQIARVILHLLDGSGKPVDTVVDGDLSAGQFSVFPFDDYDVTEELKKNKALRGQRLPFRFKRVQFPSVPAFSLTAHKTQGLTLPKLILAATLNRMGKAPTDRYLYVVLSRLRGLEGLTLLQLLPHHSHKCYAHSANLTAELKRLEKLEQETVTSNRMKLLSRLLPPARVSPVAIKENLNTSAGVAAAASPTAPAAPVSALQAAYLRIQAARAQTGRPKNSSHVAAPVVAVPAVAAAAPAFAPAAAPVTLADPPDGLAPMEMCND